MKTLQKMLPLIVAISTLCNLGNLGLRIFKLYPAKIQQPIDILIEIEKKSCEITDVTKFQ